MWNAGLYWTNYRNFLPSSDFCFSISFLVWCYRSFTTFQLYHSRQYTYPCTSAVSFQIVHTVLFLSNSLLSIIDIVKAMTSSERKADPERAMTIIVLGCHVRDSIQQLPGLFGNKPYTDKPKKPVQSKIWMNRQYSPILEPHHLFFSELL